MAGGISSQGEPIEECKVWQVNPSRVSERNNPDGLNSLKEDVIIEAAVVIIENDATDKTDSEEEQRNSRILCNRIIVCLFALCLLWVTSLQVALSIIDIYVSTPSMDSVITGCRYSYDIVVSHKEAFRDCVDRQLIQCNRKLDKSYASEKAKKAGYESANAAFLLSLQRRESNCSNALANVKASLTAWTNLGVDYIIPYKKCPPEELKKMIKVLGNATLSRNTPNTATSTYTTSSDGTIEHLAAYADALTAYNKEYVKSKTEQMRKLSIKIVKDVSLPKIKGINASFNSIMADYNQMMSCVTLIEADAKACTGDSIFIQYNETRQAIAFQAKVMFKLRDNARAFFVMIAAKIEKAEEKVRKFYMAIFGSNGIFTWIRDNLGVPSSDLCKVAGDICDFSIDDLMVGRYFTPNTDISKLRLPLGADMWYYVKDVVAQSRATIATASADISALSKSWYQEMNDAFTIAPFFSSDYNPPRYQYATNLSAEVKAQKSKSIIFKDLIASQLISVAETAAATQFKQINATTKAAAGFISTFKLSSESIDLSGFRFASWLAGLATIRGMLYLFDYVYRAIHTVRLIRKFVGKSAVHLPYVDLRPRSSNGRSSECLTYLNYALALLPYLYIQVLMVLGFVAFVAWIIVALYVPEFKSYEAGCVRNTANQTFISAKLYSIGFNYAAADGNSRLTSGMQDYNTLSSSYCSQSTIKSVSKHNTFLQSVSNANQSYQTDVSSIGLITDCLNTATLDTQFASACCSAYASSGYLSQPGDAHLRATCGASRPGPLPKCPLTSAYVPYRPPGVYVSEPACHPVSGEVSLDVPHNSIFDCEALPVCSISCKGPHKGIIHAVCKSCSCMSEWLLNSAVFHFALAIAVYTLMNVSRVMICRGIVMILWRSLTKEEFEVKILCSRVGEMKIPHSYGKSDQMGGKDEKESTDECGDGGGQMHRNDNAEEGKVEEDKNDHRLQQHELGIEEIRSGMERMLFRLVARGWVYLFFGVCLNVGWVLAAMQAQQSISYNPA